MTRGKGSAPAWTARAPLLAALLAAGLSLVPANAADPPACTPKLGDTNTWDQLGDPVLVDGDNAIDDPARWPEALRSAVDPERPCLVYRVVGDPRAVQRSADGGKTFERVHLDERLSGEGAPARFSGVYAPAPNVVYLSEAGNGSAVVKSEDGGRTWRTANGGLEGRRIGRMAMTSDPDVAYAVAVTEASPSGLGDALEVFVTRDGGRSWNKLLDSPLSNARGGLQGYSLTVDPQDPGRLVIAVQGSTAVVPGTPEPGSLLLDVEDYGESPPTPVRVAADIAEVLFARRADGSLRLYALANGFASSAGNNTNGVIYSDDETGHWSGPWTRVALQTTARWIGGVVDPVTPDKMLYFGRPAGGANALLALYTRKGFAKDSQEIVEQPNLKHAGFSVTQYRADRFGQFYLDIGLDCRAYDCPAGANKTNNNYSVAWLTLRFRAPEPGQAFEIGGDRVAAPARGGRFESVPAERCDIEPLAPRYAADAPDDAGSLAFDGTRLYYTRRAEQGPDPWSAVIRVTDPATCNETGRFVVHFDPAVYQEARRRAVSDADGKPLLPERPSIDSLAYDSVHDELWFSLTRTASYVFAYNGDADGSPLPVWSVKRDGAGVDRHAELRYWANPCAPGGVGLMAHDRVRDSLWTCYRKVPGERARTGRPYTTCLHPLFKGEVADGEVWRLRAWGVGRPGALIALRDDGESVPPRRVEQYDARTCTHTDSWTMLAPEPQPPEPDQGPTYVSSQLVCDPVTFRDRLDGSPAPAAVIWMREGTAFTPYRVTDYEGPGLQCPWPTVLSYSGATGVDPGTRLQACMTVSVPGSGGAIPDVAVRVSVAGTPAVEARTDGEGRACVPYDVPAQSLQGSRLSVQGWVVEDAHLLAGAATGSVLVGAVPVPPPPAPVVPVPGPAPPPPPIPLLPAPAPAPAPQAGVQPAVSPPGQAAAQQGMASEKEREVQLAHAQQESGAHTPAADEGLEYEFTLAVAALLALCTAAAGRALGRSPATSPATAMAHETVGASVVRRRRRRRRQ